MIEDLKADSARWEVERRAQGSRNTVGVRYRNSETHQSRQHYGPTLETHETNPYVPDLNRLYPSAPVPGSFDSPGYSGTVGYPTTATYPTTIPAYYPRAGYPEPPNPYTAGRQFSRHDPYIDYLRNQQPPPPSSNSRHIYPISNDPQSDHTMQRNDPLFRPPAPGPDQYPRRS
ncbi:hypothetical protein N0V84_006477 [Fusarium piperis]|uniref:Uncharacterized protein n=1 Tax=Fusarium piperis TaxID=1435070 RepID=A0A9W9BMZ0_9HYPO|nr:hypothetical protein N0V84_006477 [Fusarium piperis]